MSQDVSAERTLTQISSLKDGLGVPFGLRVLGHGPRQTRKKTYLDVPKGRP